LTVINRSDTAKPPQSETTRCFGQCAVFKVRRESAWRGRSHARSLKTKQHAGLSHFQARSTFREELTASAANSGPNQTRLSASRNRARLFWAP